MGRTHFIALANKYQSYMYIVINKILMNFKDYFNHVIFIIFVALTYLLMPCIFKPNLFVAKIKKEIGRKFYSCIK